MSWFPQPTHIPRENKRRRHIPRLHGALPGLTVTPISLCSCRVRTNTQALLDEPLESKGPAQPPAAKSAARALILGPRYQ
jgi:hypothetical protein